MNSVVISFVISIVEGTKIIHHMLPGYFMHAMYHLIIQIPIENAII